MFPILNPPPSSLPIPSLWVVPLHQPQASSIVHQTWTGNSFHTCLHFKDYNLFWRNGFHGHTSLKNNQTNKQKTLKHTALSYFSSLPLYWLCTIANYKIFFSSQPIKQQKSSSFDWLLLFLQVYLKSYFQCEFLIKLQSAHCFSFWTS